MVFRGPRFILGISFYFNFRLYRSSRPFVCNYCNDAYQSKITGYNIFLIFYSFIRPGRGKYTSVINSFSKLPPNLKLKKKTNILYTVMGNQLCNVMKHNNNVYW